MISDTAQDLRLHLGEVSEKMQALSPVESDHNDRETIEWRALLEEENATQQGLEICAQLSEQIERLDPTVEGRIGSRHFAGADHHVGSECRTTKANMVAQLHSHGAMIDKQIIEITSGLGLPRDTSEELEKLQATKQTIHNCAGAILNASADAQIERYNIFEDITVAENSFSFTISTIGGLVKARGLTITGGSYNVGGQITDEGFEKALEAFTRLELEPVQHARSTTAASKQYGKQVSTGSDFHKRHGRGMPLT